MAPGVFAVSFAVLVGATTVPVRIAIGVVIVVCVTFAVTEALFAPLTSAAAAPAVLAPRHRLPATFLD